MDSDRSWKYQVCGVNRASSPKGSSKPTESEPSGSLAGIAPTEDLYERDDWSGPEEPPWPAKEAAGPPSPPGPGLPLYAAALLLPLLALGVTVLAVVLAARPDSPRWDFYTMVGVTFLIILWQLAVAVWHSRHLLEALAVGLAPLAAGGPVVDRRLSGAADPRVAYVMARLLGAEERGPERKGEADCLRFMRDEVKEFDTSSHGYVIIDAAGTMVYCNAAVCQYLGYAEADLLQENVRKLMPLPYSRQHDRFLRRHAATGKRHMLDSDQPVPVVDAAGKQSMAKLRVTERVDPHDADSRYFVGRMKFHEAQRVADALRERLSKGAGGVELACQCFDMYHDFVLVLDARGAVEFANFPATQLLGHTADELRGRSVAAVAPDLAQRIGNGTVTGAEQECTLHTKGQGEVAAYAAVERVACAGQLDGYVLVCTLFLRPGGCSRPGDLGSVASSGSVSRSSSPTSGNSLRRRLGRRSPSRGSQPRAGPSGLLSRLHATARRGSVVVVDVYNVQAAGRVVPAEYEAFLSLLTQSCTKHKAHLQAVLGDRAVVTLNAAVTNNSHRSSAGALMSHVTAMWAASPAHASMKLLAAAVSQELTCGTFGTHHVVAGEALDTATMLLRVAAETRVTGALIDAVLHEELQYLYECRLVNFVTVHPREKRGVTHPVYELHAAKSASSEEWMYQVTQEAEQPHLARWQECWGHLAGHKDNLGHAQPHPTPNYGAALESLALHLLEQPHDVTARWLQMALKRRSAAGGGEPLLEVSGKLPFFMHYRLPDRLSPAAHAGGSPKVRPEDLRSRRSTDLSSSGSGDSGPARHRRRTSTERPRPPDAPGERRASVCSVISEDTD
eukprot:EG_transcript_1832